MKRPEDDSPVREDTVHRPGIARICAFCDAVFAVAITLLVLNLEVPLLTSREVNTELVFRLGKIWYSLISYVLSFLLIGILWLMHHRLFRHIKRYNELFILFNILFLMLVVLLPFSTDLFSDYRSSTLAFTIYSGNLAAVCVMLCCLWQYALKNGRLLGDESEPPGLAKAIWEVLVAAICFIIGIWVSYFSLAAARVLLWLPFLLMLGINLLGKNRSLLRLHE